MEVDGSRSHHVQVKSAEIREGPLLGGSQTGVEGRWVCR